MNWLHAQMALLDAATAMVEFGVNWFLQSTMLITIGLVTGRLLRRRGAAVQSAVYRTTLAAVLVCPITTWMLSLAGVSGWSIVMPQPWTYEQTAMIVGGAALPVLESPPSSLPAIVDATSPARLPGASDELQQVSVPVTLPVDVAASQSIGPVIGKVPSPVAGEQSIQKPATPPAEIWTFSVHVSGWLALGIDGTWLLISTTLLARLATAWWRLSRLRHDAVPADATTRRNCRELAAHRGVAAPEVLRSPYLPSPCLAGLRRPAILLPEAELSLSVRDVLIHELAHWARRDCHWNLLRQLALSAFFFQPLLWKLSRRLEATAEEVCDDYVVQYGGDRQEYAHRLVDIAELATAPMAAAGVGIVSLRSMLANRVQRIMDTSRSLSTRVGSLLLTFVLIGGLIGTMVAGLVGVGPKPALAEAGSVSSEDKTPTDNESGVDESAADAAAAETGTAAAVTDSTQESNSNAQDHSEFRYEGEVVDPSGKPVAGANFYWFRTRVHDLQPMTPRLIATTDDAGRFRFNPPSMGSADEHEAASWAYTEWITVRAPGHGASVLRPESLRREMLAGKNFLGTLARAITGNKGLTIKLPAAGDPIHGRLVDMDGQPVVGATIRIRWFNEKGAGREWSRDAEVRGANDAAWRVRVDHLLGVIEPAPLREVLPMTTTDTEGTFELRDVGPDRLVQLLVEGDRIESTEILARNEPGEVMQIEPLRSSDGVTRKVYGREFLQAVGPSKRVEGRVVDVDTGDPIAGAVVRAFAIHGDRLHGSREREQFSARTDAAGRYRISGLPVGDGNQLVAFTTGDVPYIPSGEQVDTSAAGESTPRDFQLKRGVWAEGRVFDSETDKPFVGEISYYYFRDRELEKSFLGLRGAYVDGRYWTNRNGEFRVPVLPARGILAFRYDGPAMDRDGIGRYPGGDGAESIAGSRDMGGLKTFLTSPYYLIPTNYTRVAEVNPAAGQTTVHVDMPLLAGKSVTIRVTDPEGKALTKYQAYGATGNWGWQNQESSQLEIVGLRPDERRKVFVFHRQRNLAGGTVVDLKAEGVIEVTLGKAGSVTGRLVDADGEPIADAAISTNMEKLWGEDATATWPPHPKLIANPSQIPVDAQGRFRLDGLIPGKKYDARVSAPRKRSGEVVDMMIGNAFNEVTIEPGEERDLGDIVVGSGQTESLNKPRKNLSEKPVQTQTSTISGRVTGAGGQPVAGAAVAAIGMRIQPTRGGDLSPDGETLAEGKTDGNGHYKLSLDGASSRTHRYASLIARKDGYAIAWQQLNLDARATEASLSLAPEEPIRGRLVDIEGQPAAGVRLLIQAVTKRSDDGRPVQEGVDYRGGDKVPAAWLQPVTSDEEGRLTLNGVPAGHGVFLNAEGSDRFAPQDIAINTGMPEQRGERDAAYRALVKNVAPGEEAVLALAPAQVFEGVVTYEDTREPAGHARLTIWASQQEHFGSMYLIAGKADDQGRYRISAHPGIRFGITAYPPDGAAYLARQTPLSAAIQWQAGDRMKQVDVQLPRGVLVRGTVVESGTNTPVAGASIQYLPEDANNPHTADHILTGWEGIQLSDEQGKFEIVVLPGPGRLLVHGPQGKYVMQETSERELSRGKPGGRRNYAHAIQRIEPAPGADPIDVSIPIRPGATIAGRLVDEQGDNIDEALVITRLNISPLDLRWRGDTPPTLGGKFELSGLDQGQEYTVYFLDAKRRLGATQVLRADSTDPTVVLKPCGQASARFVDSEGQPHVGFEPGLHMVVTPGEHEHNSVAAKLGKLAADADFVSNIDRTNYWPGPQSDEQGRVTFSALIPGATYRLETYKDGKPQVLKQFSVQSGEQLDLGDISIDLNR